MDRTQFTFYESFYKAISRIKKKSDRAEAYDAICAYALYGTEPDTESMSDAAAIAFELSKPNLDASRRKANSGKKGGERKQSESKTEAKQKQTASKKENKKEIEIENKCYNPHTPFSEILDAACFGGALRDSVLEWVAYKAEKRQGYEKTGFQNLVTQIKKQSAVYGEAAVTKLIKDCMASNWQGIIFERLAKESKQSGNVFMEMLEESYGTQ